MSCRGVFFDINAEEAKYLLALVGDRNALSDAANMLRSESREAEGFQASVDKAWDASMSWRWVDR